MQIVIDLAQKKQDEAGAVLQEKKSLLEAKRAKSEELKTYYEHYDKLYADRKVGLRVAEIINSRSFLQQLAVAIEFQKEQLLLAEKAVLEAQTEWRRHYLKVQSLLDLQHRYQNEENAEVERRDQRLMEEWTTARYGNSAEQ